MEIANTAAVITVVFIVISFSVGFALGAYWGYVARRIDEVRERIWRGPK